MTSPVFRPASIANNRIEKRASKPGPHNRKAGHSAFLKGLKHRRARRRERRYWRGEVRV